MRGRVGRRASCSGTLNLALADPGGLATAKFSVGDYDRDGRTDIIALVRRSPSVVYGMRAKTDGSGLHRQDAAVVIQLARPFGRALPSR